MKIVQEKYQVLNDPKGKSYRIAERVSFSEEDTQKYATKGLLRNICKQFAKEAKKDSPKSRQHNLCMLSCLAKALRRIEKETGLVEYQECIDVLSQSGLYDPKLGIVCNTGNLEMVQKAYDKMFIHRFSSGLEKICSEICSRLDKKKP